jgi:hypothetical protein
MEHKIIAIYCLIDEMLKGLHVKRVETYKGTFFPMRFKSSLNPS